MRGSISLSLRSQAILSNVRQPARNRVGAGLTPAPPTPRTCGSASGGSRRIPETTVGVGKSTQAEVAPVGVGQGEVQGWGLRGAPVALARARPFASLLRRDSQRLQRPPSGPRALPLLPPDLPQPAAQPLIELGERARGVGQREVGRPSHREAVHFADAPAHRDAPAARGEAAQAILGACAPSGRS
jgi:hypothetical protein